MSVAKTELWWVLLAQSGDKEAFNLLLSSIQPSLLRYIRTMIQNQALSEEILQETFLIIYRKLRWLEDPNVFRAWSYRIAARETWRHLKKERRNQPSEKVENAVSSDQREEELSREFRERLPALLSNVSPASRSVLVLHYLEEMKLHEVSEVLEISIGTVKSRLAYGLMTLRQLLIKDVYKKE